MDNLLVELGQLEPIRSYDESLLSIRTPEVLALIEREDPSWKAMVPPPVAEIIKTKHFFRSHTGPRELSTLNPR
jgi:hypothetical protein